MLGFEKKFVAALPLAFLCVGLASAQVPNPTTVAPGADGADIIAKGPDGVYIYHVKVVDRQLDAVNYLNRRGSTKIDFQGTELLPQASGEAKVNAVTGKTEIDVKFKGLKQANSFGPEYFTYVLWAISAEGRPQNLGELELSGDNASLNDLSSSFQTFGMIVTAEALFFCFAAERRCGAEECVCRPHTRRPAAGERALSASSQGALRSHRRAKLHHGAGDGS